MRVVPVVRLIAFRLPGDGRLTTTMEHRGGLDNDDGALSWLRRPGSARGAGACGAGAAAEARGVGDRERGEGEATEPGAVSPS